jgi:hypothetical protein
VPEITHRVYLDVDIDEQRQGTAFILKLLLKLFFFFFFNLFHKYLNCNNKGLATLSGTYC